MKQLAIIAATLLSIGFAFYCTPAPVNAADAKAADNFYQRARQLMSLGEYTEAVKSLDKAIAANPALEYYSARGKCWQNLGKIGNAIQDFTFVIKKEPELPHSTYLHRGRCYQRLNMHKEAIADFTKGIEVEDKTAKKGNRYFSYYMNRGRSYDLTNQNQKALDDYTKSLLYKGGQMDRGTVKLWRKKLDERMQNQK